MSTIVYAFAYVAMVVFLGAVLHRVMRYLKNPVHLRWELYPVAHEGHGRDAYGGSYLEDVDWWKKPREVSLFGELKVMVPEILFLKAVYEFNRPLWYATYAFHLGLYLVVMFIFVMLTGAVAQLAGVPIEDGTAVGMLFGTLPTVLGPVSFALTVLGAVLLLVRRLTNEQLRNYSAPSHYLNLMLFVLAGGLALASWATIDPSFSLARGFVTGMLTFRFDDIESPLFAAQVLVAFALVAYIPLTHMAHFFMKYFLYHDIRWGDNAHVHSAEMSAKISTVLNYPVSWAAAHVRGTGKTWAEVATFNPTAEPEKKKE
jgi:nitrate reductase gamma subunit